MTAYWSRDVPRPADELGHRQRDVAKSSLTIVIGRYLGTVVVTLRGTLDSVGATALAAALQDLIDGQGNLAIAVHLRGLDHLAPSGLQVLAAAASDLERRGGHLSLREPPAAVLRALDVAGLTRLIGHTGTSECVSSARAIPRGRPVRGPGTSARAWHPAGTGQRWDPYGGMR